LPFFYLSLTRCAFRCPPRILGVQSETVGPNEGNAVFSSPTQRTSDLYKTHSAYDPSQPLPERFDNPELTKGYNTSKLTSTNPMFFTSSQTYG